VVSSYHLLTASHDADKLTPPVTIDASIGRETLHMMNGEWKQIKADDMLMTDAEGVVCTIIYGQDKRTAVTVDTRRVLYVTYAPVGIARAGGAAHHDTLLRNVRLFAPDAEVGHQAIITASG
jgi:DNA/RNA-binding domain of Phe-tRNA-synthetase-like protein